MVPNISNESASKKQIDYSNDVAHVSVISSNELHDNKNRLVSFDDALKEIGFGKVQMQMLLVMSFLLMTVLNETMGVSFIIPASQCDLDMSTSDKGLLSSMTFFGIMISAYLWGFLGDTQGRRSIILFALFFSTLFTVLSAFASSFTLFVISRFFVGFFISATSSTTYAYIGEFNSVKNRAAIISWVSVAVGLSSVYLPLMAWWILSYDWSFELYDGYNFRPWRLLLLTYAAPGVIGGIGLYNFPESPKYLLTQNREQEALEIVQWIYRKNKNTTSNDGLRIGQLISETSEVAGKAYKGGKALFMSLINQTIPLFQRPYLLYFFTCSFLHFGTFSVAGGFGMWLPTILNKLSNSNGTNVNICSIMKVDHTIEANVINSECDDSVNTKVFADSAILGVVYTIAFIVLALVIKPVGRGGILAFTLFTSFLCGVLLAWVETSFLIVGCFCFFILFTGINVSVINGAAVNLFPTHLRAMAVCVSMLFGRLGSALSSILIGYLLERNCELTFYIFAGVALLCFFMSFILPYR